jgi:hypothetical protein
MEQIDCERIFEAAGKPSALPDAPGTEEKK